MRSVQTFMADIDDGNRVIERLIVELYEDGERIDSIVPKSPDWATWFAESWMLGLITYANAGERLFDGKPMRDLFN